MQLRARKCMDRSGINSHIIHTYTPPSNAKGRLGTYDTILTSAVLVLDIERWPSSISDADRTKKIPGIRYTYVHDFDIWYQQAYTYTTKLNFRSVYTCYTCTRKSKGHGRGWRMEVKTRSVRNIVLYTWDIQRYRKYIWTLTLVCVRRKPRSHSYCF